MNEDPCSGVVPLRDAPSLADIAGQLRAAADRIEAEGDDDDRTVTMLAVQVGESGAISGIYGWGRADHYRALGILSAAAVEMASED